MEYWKGPAIISKMDVEDFCESMIFEKGQEEIRDLSMRKSQGRAPQANVTAC